MYLSVDVLYRQLMKVDIYLAEALLLREIYTAYYERESEFCDKNVKCELWSGPGMVEFESKDC